MPLQAHAKKIITDFSARRPIRAGAFVISLYGDVILPRNGKVWMGDIIQACDQVGINESLTRTAVSRLVSSHILEGTKIGRKSYYQLTQASLIEFQHASSQIYARQPAHDGNWTVLMNFSPLKREDIKRKIERIGFGDPLNGIYMKPGDYRKELNFALASFLKENAHLMFVTKFEQLQDQLKDMDLLLNGWNLDHLANEYKAFCLQFRELSQLLQSTKNSAHFSQGGLTLRHILVHEYRKLSIKDPKLPLAYLPEDWAGTEANQIFSTLYKYLLPASEAFITQNFDQKSPQPQATENILQQRLTALA